jgi:zinc/manganese transport system substrate-binding protein
VAQVVVVESLSDVVGPAFELGCVDLDGRSATSTRQVVVVRVHDATPIQALTAVGHDDVDLAGGDQPLKLGVDRRERCLATVSSYEGVQFLGADEPLHSAEDPDDLAALGSVSGGRHPSSVIAQRLLPGTIPSNVFGMVPRRLPAALGLIVGLVMALVLSLFTWGAVSQSAPTSPSIVAGVSQWATLARQLVGKDLPVWSLLNDPNADPHEHEATVRDAARVSRATMVLLNGAGYDAWLARLARVSGANAWSIDVASLVGVSSGANPHLFYDPKAAIRFVEVLSARLERSRGSADITRRSALVLARLNDTQRTVLSIRSACANVPVAATEDVATYLLRDAGLRIVTPKALRLAIGNGVDPSIQDLATAMDQLRAHPAFLLDNVQTQTPLTSELVRRAVASHVPVIKVTETMSGADYVSWLNGVVEQITGALKSEGCLR